MGKVEAGLPVVLTMGDPAGIGPDVTLEAYAAREVHGLNPFYVIGDADVLRERARLTGFSGRISVVERSSRDGASWATDIPGTFSSALPVMHTAMPSPVRAGTPDPANGPAVIASMDRATEDVRQGFASGVVTSPIAKDVLFATGFDYPGHTGYLAELSRRYWQMSCHPVMMIAAEEMRVVPVTVHIPLAKVSACLTTDLVVETVRTTARALALDFGIETPKVACTGLNPHGGENGNIGREELEVIVPALDVLRAEGIDVAGPFPADTIFHAEARAPYDAIVAMYHDQALIPIKTLAFDRGVNVTLGLPFVRTSPDHGTAFDIAGSGTANPRSMIEAIKLAHGIAARRAGGAKP